MWGNPRQCVEEEGASRCLTRSHVTVLCDEKGRSVSQVSTGRCIA